MENNNNTNLQIINFSRELTPLPTEIVYKDNDKYTKWGDDNLYPNFLLRIFNKSAIHKGICTSKVDYIIGDGEVDADGKNIGSVKVNPIDTLEEFTQKITNDYVIFNAFAVEVIYNVLGKPIEYYHIPLNKVRANRNKSKFWVCDDWYGGSRNTLSYDRFISGANEDGKSKLFYFSNYTPSVNNVYPEVDYSGAIESIVTDTLINEFFQSNIQGGFSAGHILSTFKGIPDAENMRIGTKKLQDALSGVNGLKFIIDYNNQEGKPIDIQTVQSDDYANKLIEVIKKTERNILSAHQGTSSLLFGIEKEGSLGNSTELENAYQLFKDGYVKNRRNEIESGLNKLFAEFPSIPKFQFKDKVRLFAPVIADATKEKIYTINELRIEGGLTAIADGDRLIGSTVAPSNFSSAKDDLVLFELTEEDFDKIADKGTSIDEFTIINEYSAEDFNSIKEIDLAFDNDEDVSKYLTKENLNGKTIEEIKASVKKDLGISVTKDDLVKTLNKLVEAKVLDVSITDSKVSQTPVKQPKKDTESRVEVMYSYEKRPEVSGDKILSTSRAFCKKIALSNKLYSREDIQTMSSIFGYDVFKYCGGFYTSKTTGETTNYCRHYFKRVQVIRKGDKK